MTRPIIAITKPHRKDNWAFRAVALAVRLGGGEPFALTPAEQRKHIKVNGIVFGGGDDIFPMLYDGTPKQGHIYDRERDALEIAAAEQAAEDDIPALGICRGAQLMNVVRGGALHADVSAEYENAAYPNGVWGKAFYRKRIEIKPGSALAAAVNAETAEVNSLHKQAIKQLGDNLVATAKEPNGVIQALEDSNLSLFLGVQFHPELLIYRSDMRAIFELLAQAAAQKEPVEINRA
ncbi:MAG: gamma-glutamyl-gamma-aminobutyrate hydrolase family protein [Marinicaulis sp.]|nr:gamma-glutamyl-gamma-aminobutyrate hydrolase family protein [Marinicaulis sp.]